MFRKILFWVHLGAGLSAGLVVLVMALTGMMMAFEPQIVEAVEKNVRKVQVPEGASRMKLDELAVIAAGTVRNARPEGFTVRSEADRSVVINFGKNGGAVYVNPYTGAVLGGESKAHDFLHQVEDIHRRLAWKDKGEAVTGAANAFMLFLVISGLYLWWPRNWHGNSLKAILIFNPRLEGKQRDWNWHNVIGFWCLPMLLVTTLSGLIMSYSWANTLLFRLAGSEPPPQKREAAAEPGKKGLDQAPLEAAQAPLEILFSNAARKSAGWQSISFRLPQKPGAPATALILERPHLGYPKARSQVSLNAVTGDEVKWEPYTSHSRGRVWRAWARYLHTGEALTLPGQLLAFVGSAGAVMLVWTGFLLSWRRFFKKSENRFRAGSHPVLAGTEKEPVYSRETRLV